MKRQNDGETFAWLCRILRFVVTREFRFAIWVLCDYTHKPNKSPFLFRIPIDQHTTSSIHSHNMRAFRNPLTRALRAAAPRTSLHHTTQIQRTATPVFLSFKPIQPLTQLRTYADTTATPSQPLPHRPAPHRNPNEPVYELTFTCKACQHRSAHTVSKQGYHNGTVLITCPGCKARHLISDHLHVRRLL